MGVPSILNCDIKERRRRWRRALIKEYAGMAKETLANVLPVIAGDVMALIMCAALFTVSAMLVISVI